MNITVILCTYNRCEMLREALTSAMSMKLPEDTPWQVLVVDSNSGDKTPEVVSDICTRYPGRVRYIFEAKPGKSHALNAGIRAANADVVAFMDDDVTVDPLWLANLTACLGQDEWVGAGGRIIPVWTSSPPAWIPREGRYPLGPLAMFDLGPQAGQLSESPIGTNMAFKRTIFEKHGGFRTDLGPRPGSEIRGEDSEFGNRLLAAGERLRYEPSAVVYHPVAGERIRKAYFLSWFFDKARSSVLEFGIPRDPRGQICGVPLDLYLRFAVWTLRWMVACEPSKRFYRKLTVWTVAGQIAECYRQSRTTGTHAVRPSVQRKETA
jgi:glycosyltransferase involved in cell wall biosynthesis